jgi:uncharacterized membrane protein YbhN (UPF0104 family)
MGRKMLIKIISGLALSVVIIYFTVKAMGGLNPGQIFAMKINWGLAILSAAIFAFSNYVRGLSYTYGMDRSITHMMAFRIIGIGHSTNMVLPLHAGEALRFPYFPKEYSMLERTKQVAVQGVTDLIVIVVLAIASIPFAGFREPILGTLKIVGLVLLILMVVGTLVFFLVPGLRKYSKNYLNTRVIWMFVWAFASWIVIELSMWVALIGYGISAADAFRMSLAAFSATNVANFIPASPGSIGLFEYGVVLGLGGLGVTVDEAKFIGVYLHFIQYIAMIPLGVGLYLSGFADKKRGFMTKEEKNRLSRRGKTY